MTNLPWVEGSFFYIIVSQRLYAEVLSAGFCMNGVPHSTFQGQVCPTARLPDDTSALSVRRRSLQMRFLSSMFRDRFDSMLVFGYQQ